VADVCKEVGAAMSAGSPRLFPIVEGRTSDEHYTPRWVFERMAITFDLDVCSLAGGLPWIPAERAYAIEDDGLAQPWLGRVWMNPPYSNAKPWVHRFIEHGHGIALLPHAKSIWHSEIWDAADALAQPPRRVIFISGDGDVSLPTFFAAFGDECVDAISRLGVVRRIA
jgi:hypothetical protein